MDSHYCAAIFRYVREYAVLFRDSSLFLCLDDKHRVKVGEPDTIQHTHVHIGRWQHTSDCPCGFDETGVSAPSFWQEVASCTEMLLSFMDFRPELKADPLLRWNSCTLSTFLCDLLNQITKWDCLCHTRYCIMSALMYSSALIQIQWRFQSGQVARASDMRGAHGRLKWVDRSLPG